MLASIELGRVALAIAMLWPAARSTAAVYEIEADGRVIDLEAGPPRRETAGPARTPRLSRPDPSVPESLRAAFSESGDAYELSTDLIEAVAWIESRFRADVRSPAGADGVMQLMPATARDLGVDAHDPRQNVSGGTSYLRQLLNRYHGDTIKALAAYNAGPDAVDRHGGLPPFPETRRYVARILDRLARVSLSQESQP